MTMLGCHSPSWDRIMVGFSAGGEGGGSRIFRIYHFLPYGKGLIVGPYFRVVTTLS